MILCTAAMDNEEADGILKEISKLINRVLVIMVGTGQELWFSNVPENIDLRVKQVENRPRRYSEVMYEKVKAVIPYCNPYCNNDSTVFMVDPDYALSPWSIAFGDIIFKENPDVDFLSLLRGPGVALGVGQTPIEERSGFRFFRWHSCMGGSLMVRFGHFLPLFLRFCQDFGVTSESRGIALDWDVEWFDWYEKMTGKSRSVWTTVDWSLMQHCNLGSKYGRAGEPMRAINYDPRINPFKWRGQQNA